MPLNLAEVPADDMVQELCRRNEASVVITSNGEQWSVILDGNGFTCEGMIRAALRELELAVPRHFENE